MFHEIEQAASYHFDPILLPAISQWRKRKLKKSDFGKWRRIHFSDFFEIWLSKLVSHGSNHLGYLKTECLLWLRGLFWCFRKKSEFVYFLPSGWIFDLKVETKSPWKIIFPSMFLEKDNWFKEFSTKGSIWSCQITPERPRWTSIFVQSFLFFSVFAEIDNAIFDVQLTHFRLAKIYWKSAQI